MAADVTLTLSGVPELLGALDELGRIGKRQALQGAMKKGAEVIAAEARVLAPRGNDIGPRQKFDPHLADTIVVRSSLSRSQKRKRGGRQAEAEVFVGSTAPHAHLVEFGHLLVKARHEGAKGLRGPRGEKKLVAVKTKRVVGHVPAYPFLRPAFDAKKQQATVVMFKELGNEIVKVARRFRRQAEKGKLARAAREAFKMELGL